MEARFSRCLAHALTPLRSPARAVAVCTPDLGKKKTPKIPVPIGWCSTTPPEGRTGAQGLWELEGRISRRLLNCWKSNKGGVGFKTLIPPCSRERGRGPLLLAEGGAFPQRGFKKIEAPLIFTALNTHSYSNMCVCMCVYTHRFIYIYIYTHTYTYMHTHIYMHVYIHNGAGPWCLKC